MREIYFIVLKILLLALFVDSGGTRGRPGQPGAGRHRHYRRQPGRRLLRRLIACRDVVFYLNDQAFLYLSSCCPSQLPGRYECVMWTEKDILWGHAVYEKNMGNPLSS